MKRVRLPKYVQAFIDRHGKPRHYFNRPGFRRPIPGLAFSTEFMDAYKLYLDAWHVSQNAQTSAIGRDRIRPGSLAALMASYYRSSEFQTLRPITQKTYQNALERIRKEHGDRLARDLKREHIKALMAKKADKPDQANRLLKMLRLLMRHALDVKLRTDDPCHGIRKLKTGSTGFRTWSEDEIQTFYAAHPPGSRARLALDLLLYTGQRRQDVVKLGRQHLRGNFLVIRQSKTGTSVSIPVDGRLREVLNALPSDRLTFIVGATGRPMTPESFTNWFRAAASDFPAPLKCRLTH